MGARLSRSGRLPGRGLREPDRPPALPERTLEALPAHQLDRAHLRRDTPPDQGDRPAPRGEDLRRPRLRGARPATPRLARDDDDAASPQTPPRSPARAPRRAGRSRFRRHRDGSRIGSRRNLRLELFTPRVGRHHQRHNRLAVCLSSGRASVEGLRSSCAGPRRGALRHTVGGRSPREVISVETCRHRSFFFVVSICCSTSGRV